MELFDEFLRLLKDHYWGSLHNDEEIILKHIDAVASQAIKNFHDASEDYGSMSNEGIKEVLECNGTCNCISNHITSRLT